MAKVERHYDEKRKRQTVVGRFAPKASVAIVLVGTPGAPEGGIRVKLELPSIRATAACESLEVLVNGVPTKGEKLRFSRESSLRRLQAHYAFETFKPLAQHFATFGVRACGYDATLDETALAELQKFFVIYAEIARDLSIKQEANGAEPQIRNDTTVTDL